MAKGEYTAVISTPSTVYTNTSTKKATYVFYVDGSNMLSGDTLKVSLTTDTTSVTGVLLTDYITIDNLNEDSISMSFPVFMMEDDTYSVILEQTTGTARVYDWAVSLIEY